MNPRPPRSPKGRVPHARLFAKRLRRLQNDVQIAYMLKQNLELRSLVQALSEKLLSGKSRAEMREVLREVYAEQRRIYNETLSRQAIKQARNVDDLLALLQEIQAVDEDAG